jgi:leucyl aminopeptidase
MSATLTVELDPGPVERTRADVVVVFFFDSDRPLRGGAGRADWRLCGQLSRLILAGKLTGALGDAVLMPTGGGLAAPLLIGLGLGPRNTFDAGACEALGREAVTRAQRLGAGTVALPLPDPHAGDLPLPERIDALVTGAVLALAELSVDLRLRLVPPIAEVARAQKAVAKLLAKPQSSSVGLFLAGDAAPRSARSPLGARGSSTEPPQLIK